MNHDEREIRFRNIVGVNELNKNLIGKNVLDMLEPKSVTYEMMKMSLGYLMFLKRKRCGKVKARGCADGRSQRKYSTKLESSSPTVKTHALFLSCLVDAVEGRKVDVGDILEVCWWGCAISQQALINTLTSRHDDAIDIDDITDLQARELRIVDGRCQPDCCEFSAEVFHPIVFLRM